MTEPRIITGADHGPDVYTTLMAELKDIKENHLFSIYARLGNVEADARWVKRLMAGTFTGVVVIAGGVLALVAKAL